MSGPLSGIRVVEFAGIGPCPFAAMLLSDMGAEVVRIGRPDTALPDDKSITDRGRRFINVDLTDPAIAHQVLELLDNADALMEGYRPGVMERLGLGPKEVLARNPRLVYGRMTGWGQNGPLANAAGHDINYIAITGALAAIGPRDRPIPPLNLVGDFGGGALYLVVGLLAGIIESRRSGLGQVVDAAMCDGTVSLMTMFYEMFARGQWVDRREDNLIDGGAPFYGAFECADGKHVTIGPIEAKFYAEFLECVGLIDPAFARRDDKRYWPTLMEKIRAAFKHRTRDEWCAILEGTDVCFGPVLTLAEAPKHRHLVERSTFLELNGVIQPAPAPRFSRTPSRIQNSSTEHGIASLLQDWREAST